MFAIRDDRDAIVQEDLMKAARKVKTTKSFGTSLVLIRANVFRVPARLQPDLRCVEDEVVSRMHVVDDLQRSGVGVASRWALGGFVLLLCHIIQTSFCSSFNVSWLFRVQRCIPREDLAGMHVFLQRGVWLLWPL